MELAVRSDIAFCAFGTIVSGVSGERSAFGVGHSSRLVCDIPLSRSIWWNRKESFTVLYFGFTLDTVRGNRASHEPGDTYLFVTDFTDTKGSIFYSM